VSLIPRRRTLNLEHQGARLLSSAKRKGGKGREGQKWHTLFPEIAGRKRRLSEQQRGKGEEDYVIFLPANLLCGNTKRRKSPLRLRVRGGRRTVTPRRLLRQFPGQKQKGGKGKENVEGGQTGAYLSGSLSATGKAHYCLRVTGRKEARQSLTLPVGRKEDKKKDAWKSSSPSALLSS